MVCEQPKANHDPDWTFQQLRARLDLAVKVEDFEPGAVCLWRDIDCVSTVEFVQSGHTPVLLWCR